MPPGPLKKSLGQHHLKHSHLCRPLVDHLAPRDRRVVEIGPGGGVLTAELLEAGARVLAWELDPDWAFELRRRLPGGPAIVVGDALAIDWRRGRGELLAAGNLPYGIATALVRRLLVPGSRVRRAAFLVQLEVAQRLAAVPGEAAYGALSVIVAARARVEILGRVRPGSFVPPPRVEGAFVGLELVDPPVPADALERFNALVHRAFGQRRKILRNNLRGAAGRRVPAALLEAAGIHPGARAEELDLPAFVRLFQALSRSGEEAASPGRW